MAKTENAGNKNNSNSEEKINRIILIGNGFDLAHGLKTGYKDFIDWFWEKQIKAINDTENTPTEWVQIDNVFENLHYQHKRNDFFVVKHKDIKYTSNEKDEKKSQHEPKQAAGTAELELESEQKTKSEPKPKFNINDIDGFKKNLIYKNKFLEIIEKRKKTLNNWVDIEELYFQILDNCKNRIKDENVYEIYTVEQLNRDFRAIKSQLKEFIKERNEAVNNKDDKYSEYTNSLKNGGLINKIKEIIKKDAENKILLLNFNFTDTISTLYNNINKNTTIISIHGEESKPTKNPMIIGYGDEVAEASIEIEKLNNNDFLENVKSIKYIETGNYSKFLSFIEQETDYEVFVFGHSCGNSDRTLLKALFESNYCKRIRCFYYYNEEEKTDDFSMTVDNIYRKFGDKTNFRKKICIKDNDVFPQYGDYGVKSPFEPKKTIDISSEKEKQPEQTSIVQQLPIETYKNEKMVKVDVADNFTYTLIENQVKRTIQKSFYISKYQVTQKEWEKIMKDKPSYFSENGGGKDRIQGLDTKDFPVECVSWYDCISFCNKLSENHKLRKYYNINGENITVNEDADGFRLPTEAEWEYAARGGKDSKNYAYSGGNNLKDVGWYYENSGDKALDSKKWSAEQLNKNNCKTHPVGQKQPNELGLYDMSGNVWEWCEDCYDNNSRLRVLRGGGWLSRAGGCRVSNRRCREPDSRFNFIGFRLARSL